MRGSRHTGLTTDLCFIKEITAATPGDFLYSGSKYRAISFAKDGNSKAFPFPKGSAQGSQGVRPGTAGRGGGHVHPQPPSRGNAFEARSFTKEMQKSEI